MLKLPTSLQRLINELSKLPGIGPKTAQRLAFYLLKKDLVDIGNLSAAIAQIKDGIVFCSVCHIMAETDPCNICGDIKRDHSIICVVEESLDAVALEKPGAFHGVYHILGGVLNPLEGIGPEQLEIASLINRIQSSAVGAGLQPAQDQGTVKNRSLPDGHQPIGIKELIIATNPSLEGETTAMQIAKMMKDYPSVKVTRIARGLPTGGDLEYADDITLMRAMEGRREY